MAQGADAASTHLGEGSRGERRAAAREEEDGGDDDEPGGTAGRAGDAAAEEREEAEDQVQTRRCAPPTATAERGPTTSQTDFHGGNRLRVGRVAAASTLPTLGNRCSSPGEEFPLPLHRSREIDARNIQSSSGLEKSEIWRVGTVSIGFARRCAAARTVSIGRCRFY